MFSLRRPIVLIFCLAWIGCIGCRPNPASQPSETSLASVERPPLRVWIVDAPEIERELLIRWQASSDQSLAIQNLTSRELLSRKEMAFDSIIYPGNIMGDLVERSIVSKLPDQVTTPASAAISAGTASTVAASNSADIDVSKSWPVRFRSIASYAGKFYALPLGSNTLAVVSKNTDVAPLLNLHDNLQAPQGTAQKSVEHWNAYLQPIEKVTDISKARSQLLEKLQSLTEQERQTLVDLFLWTASTTDKNRRGLFDLSKMTSRLTEAEFINAAKILNRLLLLFPESLFAQPADAWPRVELNSTNTKSMAIGWPNSKLGDNETKADQTDTDQTNTNDADTVQVVPILWNPNRGLVASIGKGTRQTSVSIQFLIWLSLPEQREALRGVSSRVELLADQPDRNAGRDDYQKYMAAVQRSQTQEGMIWALRLVHAQQYRDSLADALVQIMQTPEQTESIMAACSTKWDSLTETLGKDQQRNSEERSQGFQK